MKNKIYEYVHTHTVNLLRSIVQDGRGVPGDRCYPDFRSGGTV